MDNPQNTLREAYAEAITSQETPVEETPVVEAPTVETAAVEETAEQKAERARDESGKFVKQDKSDKPEKPRVDTAPAKAPIEAQVTQRPPRPSSWKKDYEKDWETLNPRLAAYIDQREKEYAKGVSTYKQEWDRAKPVLDALTPYQEHMQKFGIRPEQLVQNLAAAHQALAMGSPQEKLQRFAKLAQDYGVDLRALMPRQPQMGPDGRPIPPSPQAQIGAILQQQIAPIRQELQQFKRAQIAAQQAQISSEIERFKQHEGHEHFEELKETMASLLDKGIVQDLESAYSTAIRMPQHDDIWSAMQESKRKADEARRAQEAQRAVQSAKSKAVSLKSSSPGAAASTGSKNSLRDTYAEQVNASLGRV